MTPGKSISWLVGIGPGGAGGPLLHPVPPLLDARLRLSPRPRPTTTVRQPGTVRSRATGCGDRLGGRMGDNVDPGGLHGGGQVVGGAAARSPARPVLRGDRRHDHGPGGPLDPGHLRGAEGEAHFRAAGGGGGAAARAQARRRDRHRRRACPAATGAPRRSGPWARWCGCRGDFDAAVRARAARGRAADAGRARRATRSRRSIARASPSIARPTSPWTPPASIPTRSWPSSCSLLRYRAAATLSPLDKPGSLSPLGKGQGEGHRTAMPSPLLARLAERPLLCDGAMGTLLYARGVALDACFDVLNVNEPKLVQARPRGVHRGRLRTAIETNTFGANRFKLGVHGLPARVREINLRGAQAGARRAREHGARRLRPGLDRPARQVPGPARLRRAGRRRAPRSTSRRRGCWRAASTRS